MRTLSLGLIAFQLVGYGLVFTIISNNAIMNGRADPYHISSIGLMTFIIGLILVPFYLERLIKEFKINLEKNIHE